MIGEILKKKEPKEELNDKLKTLEVAVARLEEIYSAKTESVAEVENLLASLRNDMVTLSEQKKTLASEKDEAQVAAAIESSKVSAARDVAGSLIESVNKTNEAVVNSLEGFTNKIESSLRVSEAELIALYEKKKSALDADLAVTKDTLKTLTAEINTLSKAKEVASEVLADANTAFAILKEEMVTIQKDLASQKEAISSATGVINNFVEEIRGTLVEVLEISKKAKEESFQISTQVSNALTSIDDSSAKVALRDAAINAKFQALAAKENATEKMLQFAMNSMKEVQA